MQDVINGFSHEKILAVHAMVPKGDTFEEIFLDGIDLYFVQWIIKYRRLLTTKDIGGKNYFLVDYARLEDDLKFLRLKRRALNYRFAKLCELGLLDRAERSAGMAAAFIETDEFFALYSSPSADPPVKTDDYILESHIHQASMGEISEPEARKKLQGSARNCEGLQEIARFSDKPRKNMRGRADGGASHNICTNSVRTLEPSNNNQPGKSQEITSVLRPTDNNQLSISQELSDTYPVEKDPKENIPYGDIKEKGKKRAPKGTEMFPILLPILDESTLAAPLKEALRGWLEYKAERKEKYVPTGFKSLLTQAKKNAEKYGDDAVIDLIDECKANNYQGIIWDKLAKLPAKAQQPKLEAEHASVKRPDPEIEWRKSRFAPRDYRAGLRSISTSELREYPKNSGKYVPYWMIPGYMQEYPAGSGKYVPYYELPGYDPEHDENHWW